MLRKVVLGTIVLSMALALKSGAREAETPSVLKDGLLVSLSVFAPAAGDMQETYGLVPSLGVRGSFASTPEVSIVCRAHLMQGSGAFYHGPGPLLEEGRTRLRAALAQFGVKLSSPPKDKRKLFAEGGLSLAWAGERFKEADGEIRERDHNGTGMGMWLGLGFERFLKEWFSWGVEGRFNLCEVRARYRPPEDHWPQTHYSINLSGISIDVFLGLYK